MSVADEIIAARKYGVTHCGVSSQASPSISELAAEFGLAGDPANFREIDTHTARRLAQLVLNRDMAYNAEIIPADRAAELADQFLAQFGTDGVRFYTNGTFHEARGPKLTWAGASWDPVTAATFDTGVLVIGPRCSGCLWVEDED
jgi:hypothetical protein